MLLVLKSASFLRSVALCFVRFSELSHIKACDVKFFPTHASIFLESSKTDINSVTGSGLVIAGSDLPTCPVKALEEYISTAQIDHSEDSPLYRALATLRLKEMVSNQGIC